MKNDNLIRIVADITELWQRKKIKIVKMSSFPF